VRADSGIEIVSLVGERVAVMAGAATPGHEVVLETDRLLLRPWRVSEVVIQRELWTERDPRVPPHRRHDADGRPTVADIEDWIRDAKPSPIGLLALERKADCCGRSELWYGSSSDLPPCVVVSIMDEIGPSLCSSFVGG